MTDIAEHSDIFWKTASTIPFKQYETTASFETVVQKLLPLIIPPEELKLIRLAFNDKLSQKDTDDFLQNWDIERYGAHGALLLSYIQKKFPELDFHEYTGPRLAGLFNYYRFRNLELISQYKKIVEKLNESNIIPVIMKGGALKYLRPELPRIMGDIDILIPDNIQFEKAKQIILSLGYEQFCDAGHSIDFHKSGDKNNGVLDMHRRIDELMENYELLNQNIISRAAKQKVFQTQSFVPCAEDLVFISLFHLAKNMLEGTCIKNFMYTIFDMEFFTSKPDFNWQIILQNAKDGKCRKNIYLAIIFINALLPNSVPDSLKKELIDDEKVLRELDKDYFYARFVHKVKYARKKISFLSTLSDRKKFTPYVGSKIKYIFTKRIYNSDRLLKIVFSWRKKIKSWNI